MPIHMRTRTVVTVLSVMLLLVGYLPRVTAQSTPSTPSPAELQALRARAEKGDPVAQNELGKRYNSGDGVVQDFAEAVLLFRKAAEQGLADAQRNLGLAYVQGQGILQDYADAVAWFREAADQGYAGGQNGLGTAYANGQGVAQDYAQAVAWYRKAADQGHPQAQNGLALAYAKGQGVAQDDAQAVAWYRKAAEHGHATAQSNLGLAYAFGQGVAQDFGQSVEWYRKAADQGFAPVQSNLGADRTRPVEIPGLSILPPQGEDWFLFPVAPQEHFSASGLIRFGQKLGTPVSPEDARQVLAGVSVLDTKDANARTPAEVLEAFTRGVKESIGQMITARQRLIGFDAALDSSPGATCVRYNRLTEIAGQFAAFPGVLGISSTRGLYCVHPRWPQFHIDLTYQQNYAKGQGPLSRDRESDDFLRGVAFTAVRPLTAPEPVIRPDGTLVYRPRDDKDVALPRIQHEVKPAYPPEAMRARIEGLVVLDCVVEADGTVGNVTVLRSLDAQLGLDDEAVRAVRQWRFVPAMRRGQPVAVAITIELTFSLKQ